MEHLSILFVLSNIFEIIRSIALVFWEFKSNNFFSYISSENVVKRAIQVWIISWKKDKIFLIVTCHGVQDIRWKNHMQLYFNTVYTELHTYL